MRAFFLVNHVVLTYNSYFGGKIVTFSIVLFCRLENMCYICHKKKKRKT